MRFCTIYNSYPYYVMHISWHAESTIAIFRGFIVTESIFRNCCVTWHVSAGFFWHGVYWGCIKSYSLWKTEQGIKVGQGKLNKGYSAGYSAENTCTEPWQRSVMKMTLRKHRYSTGNKSLIKCLHNLFICPRNKNFIAVDFEEKQTIQSTLHMLDHLIYQATKEWTKNIMYLYHTEWFVFQRLSGLGNGGYYFGGY